jgi:RNA polymerase sigma factor (sigma-70 family)
MKLTDAQRQIAEDNHNLIYGFLWQNHLDVDEWYGIIAIGYLKAVLQWDSDRGKLSTFAFLTMKSAYVREINRRNRLMRKESCISIHSPICDGANIEIGDLLPDPYDLADQCVSRVDLEAALKKLTSDQRRILSMALDGVYQSDIAIVMGISQPSISRTLKKTVRQVTGLEPQKKKAPCRRQPDRAHIKNTCI